MKKKSIYDEILNSCCLTEGMEWMCQPFIIDKKAMATNRHILAWTDKANTSVDNILADKQQHQVKNVIPGRLEYQYSISIETMKEALAKCKMVPLTETVNDTCTECDGEGVVDYEYRWNYRSYEIEGNCPKCEGSGISETEKPTDKMVLDEQQPYSINGKLFADKYMRFLLNTAGKLNIKTIDVVFNSAKNYQPDVFRLGEFYFLIMPLASEDGYDVVKIARDK